MSGNENTPRTKTNEELLSECMLSQFRLSVAGVGLGTAYSLKYKAGLAPMIAAGALGTSADLIYGYLVECAHFRQGGDKDE